MTDDNYEKGQTLFQMVKTFSKEIVKYVAAGSPVVSLEDYEERLEVCNTCPHLIKKNQRCGKCGCLLQHKAKWKTTDCPIHKCPDKEQQEDHGKK